MIVEHIYHPIFLEDAYIIVKAKKENKTIITRGCYCLPLYVIINSIHVTLCEKEQISTFEDCLVDYTITIEAEGVTYLYEYDPDAYNFKIKSKKIKTT